MGFTIFTSVDRYHLQDPSSGCLISMTMSTTYDSDKKLGTISSLKACTSDGKILVLKSSTGRHKNQTISTTWRSVLNKIAI
jgi:hypothetical protein